MRGGLHTPMKTMGDIIPSLIEALGGVGRDYLYPELEATHPVLDLTSRASLSEHGGLLC